ncbi:unnamed protein product [Rhizopus stolonifer]
MLSLCKAYDSLCRCPVTFEHPSQSQQLEGIGKVMAEQLTNKMIEYCAEHGLPNISPIGKRKKRANIDDNTEEDDSSTKPKRQKKAYVPTFRSGAYAILLCLQDMQAEGRDNLTKEQICNYAQKYCDNSMTLSDPGRSYTAFNGMKTLIDKGYVYKNGKPVKYMLTETGTEMADKLRNAGDSNNISQASGSNTSLNQPSISQPDSSSPSTKGKRKGKANTSRTTALLESMLGPNYDIPSGPDMSLYVINPSKHQSITINGKTTIYSSQTPSNTSEQSDVGQAINRAQTNNNNRGTSSSVTKNNNSSLARQVLESSTGRGTSSSSRNIQLARDVSILNLDDDSEAEEIDLLSQSNHPVSLAPNEDEFFFTYLDVSEKPVKHVSSASIDFDEENACLAYLIRFYSKQKKHPKATSLIKVKNDGADYCLGYLPETQIVTVCPGLPSYESTLDETEEDFWPEDPSASRDDSEIIFSQPTFDSQPKIDSQQTFDSQLTFDSQTQQTASSQQRQIEQVQADVSQLIESEHIEPIFPDEYEIMLILDSREIQMRSNRNYIQDRLSSKGINFSTRSLDLGDVIWVARKKGSTQQSDELFLDYVVERKRLDDLVTSIKDGRFIEQKERLKRSGAKKVIYVVEEYNREDAANFGLQAIQTAMSSTQIIDRIFLKRTINIDETIDYLVTLTKMMERIYKHKRLYPIPEHIVTSQNYLELRKEYKEKLENDDSAYLISYPVFNQINSKNGSTNLHEMYLRMLMCIKGVNAEKALALMRVYPTPHSLLSAFRDKTASDAKNLAKEATQNQISRRKWGLGVSEKLYEVWGSLEHSNEIHSD